MAHTVLEILEIPRGDSAVGTKSLLTAFRGWLIRNFAMLRITAIASMLCALTLTGCHDATALQCPAPQLQSSTGDLKESASDIRAYQDRFSSGFSQNDIQEAIASLRKKYPDASKSAISNYLVAAYCPNAVRQAVGVSDQRAKLASFESAVRAQIGD